MREPCPSLNHAFIKFPRDVIHLTVIWVTGRIEEACLRVAQHPKGGRHAKPKSLEQERAEGRIRLPRARHTPSARTFRAPARKARCCRQFSVFQAAPLASRQYRGQWSKARPTHRVAK